VKRDFFRTRESGFSKNEPQDRNVDERCDENFSDMLFHEGFDFGGWKILLFQCCKTSKAIKSNGLDAGRFQKVSPFAPPFQGLS
jgi:hypothetical protein